MIERISMPILVFFAVSILYAFYVSPQYAYMGFGFDFHFVRIVVCSVLLFVVSLLTKRVGVDGMYGNIILGAVLIPSMVFYVFNGVGVEYILTVGFSCLVVVIFSGLKFKPVRFFRISNNLLLFSLFLFSVLYLLSVLAFGGAAFINFDLSKVYDFREASAGNLPSFYAYLSPVVGKVVIPFIVAIAISSKKYLIAFLGGGMSVLVFAFTAHKSPLFYPLAVVFIYFSVKGGFVKWFWVGFLGFLLVSVVDAFVYQWFGVGGWVANLFVRRLLLVPALLNHEYLSFFSSNDFYYWSGSKLSMGLVSANYSYNMPSLIGGEAFGSFDVAANTGWIGSGYGNAGLVGVFLYSLVIGVLVSYFKSQSKILGEPMVMSVTFVVMLTLFVSTDLTTSFLTHGLLFLIASLTVFSSSRPDDEPG